MEILNTIGFENLIMTSIDDFIKTYYYDFKHNNSDIINILNLEEDIKRLEKLGTYFAKLTIHFHEFYKYNSKLKALTCIIAGFDSYRNEGKLRNKKAEEFFREWILFIINYNGFNSYLINEVYCKLMEFHSNYENIPLINFNLKKFYWK
jgi:hypothetical protein